MRKIVGTDYEKLKEIIGKVHKFHMDMRPDLFVADGFFNIDYFREIVGNSMSFVYDIGDGIAGVVIAFERKPLDIPVLKKRCVCSVEVFAVADDYQGQGIGHAMYDYLADECKKAGIDAIELTAYPANGKAIAFYEEIGFNVKSVRYEQRV